MRLSIIVPTYNCEAYLEEGIRSVLGQLPEDCELILVDDGSMDGTPQIVKKTREAHANVKIRLCPHKGASGARNAGIEMAEGDYVAFMDCDDCLREGFLSEALPMLESGADLYIFGIRRIFLKEEPQNWTVEDKVYETVSDFADEYIRTRKLLIYSNCNKFYKTAILKEHGIRFDETVSFGEDRMLNYAFLPHCGRIVTSSLVMLLYLQRSETSMSSRRIPHFEEELKRLHEEKMQCFLSLSKGTTEGERQAFVDFDLAQVAEAVQAASHKTP